jgi:hypothetical protein
MKSVRRHHFEFLSPPQPVVAGYTVQDLETFELEVAVWHAPREAFDGVAPLDGDDPQYERSQTGCLGRAEPAEAIDRPPKTCCQPVGVRPAVRKIIR